MKISNWIKLSKCNLSKFDWNEKGVGSLRWILFGKFYVNFLKNIDLCIVLGI